MTEQKQYAPDISSHGHKYNIKIKKNIDVNNAQIDFKFTIRLKINHPSAIFSPFVSTSMRSLLKCYYSSK